MKRLLTLVVVLVLSLSLCACGSRPTDSVSTRTESDGTVLQQYFTDIGDLFCTKQTCPTTGLQTITYFYWRYDAGGRKCLLSTETIVIDKEGNLTSRVVSDEKSS